MKVDLNKKAAGRIVCDCLQVTEARLVGEIKARSLRSLDDIITHTCAGGGCTGCHPLLQKYLRRTRGGATSAPLRPPTAPPGSSAALPL